MVNDATGEAAVQKARRLRAEIERRRRERAEAFERRARPTVTVTRAGGRVETIRGRETIAVEEVKEQPVPTLAPQPTVMKPSIEQRVIPAREQQSVIQLQTEPGVFTVRQQLFAPGRAPEVIERKGRVQRVTEPIALTGEKIARAVEQRERPTAIEPVTAAATRVVFTTPETVRRLVGFGKLAATEPVIAVRRGRQVLGEQVGFFKAEPVKATTELAVGTLLLRPLVARGGPRIKVGEPQFKVTPKRAAVPTREITRRSTIGTEQRLIFESEVTPRGQIIKFVVEKPGRIEGGVIAVPRGRPLVRGPEFKLPRPPKPAKVKKPPREVDFKRGTGQLLKTLQKQKIETKATQFVTPRGQLAPLVPKTTQAVVQRPLRTRPFKTVSQRQIQKQLRKQGIQQRQLQLQETKQLRALSRPTLVTQKQLQRQRSRLITAPVLKLGQPQALRISQKQEFKQLTKQSLKPLTALQFKPAQVVGFKPAESQIFRQPLLGLGKTARGRPIFPRGRKRLSDIARPFRPSKKVKAGPRFAPSVVGLEFRLPQADTERVFTGLGARGIPGLKAPRKRKKKRKR